MQKLLRTKFLLIWFLLLYFTNPLPPILAPPKSKGKRHIPLQKSSNFRDIGGYKSKDGRTLIWKKIYRSGELNRLTKSDLLTIEKLHLKTILDFRETSRKNLVLDKLPKKNSIQKHHLPIGITPIPRMALMMLIYQKDGPIEAQKNLYKKIIKQGIPSYQKMFEILLEKKNYPVLIHDNFGVDYTGIGICLIFFALQIPKKTMEKDYLLSQDYLKEVIQRILRFIPKEGKPLLEARKIYLESAFQTIQKEYGSIQNYLKKYLKMTPIKQEKLRNILLE